VGVLSGDSSLVKNETKDSIFSVESLGTRIEVQVQGVLQVWHVWNKGAKDKLVLLHGGSGSWTHWLRNITVLSAAREVWALDIPGFGDSQLPPQASDVDDLVPYVIEGMRVIAEGEALDVIGFSFGGLLAGFIAATDRSIVRSLILVGVPALGLTGTPLALRGLRSDMKELEVQVVVRHNLKVMMIANEDMINSETLELQQKNIARDRLKRRRIARGDAMLRLQKDWSCPVFAIWGELDALYKGRIDEVRERLKDCDLREFNIIPNAGHWVQYEQATAFNACILKILDRFIDQRTNHSSTRRK
jgi:pimeloyl-ACP methyl ester carboxylesterase